MKRLATISALLFALPAYADLGGTDWPSTSTGGITTVTALPASPTDGQIVIVTDDSAIDACDSGAGTEVSACVYDAGSTTWRPLIQADGVHTFASGQTLISPNFTLKSDWNNTALNDNDCTGDQGKAWYDSTDQAFEFCNANTGAPAIIATTSGDVTKVGTDCTSGDCFVSGGTGTKLESDANFQIEVDANNDGTSTFAILNGASGSVLEVDEDGDVTATSFTADPSATPTQGFQDSDMGGTPDTNASIVANCPTGTTAGADEDCDLAFNTQVAGVLTEAFRIDTTDAGAQTVAFAKATTLQNNDVVDAELEITENDCSVLYTPGSTIADTYDVKSVWEAYQAVTITRVWCETDTGTVNMDVQIDDGTPADVMGTDLVCDTTGEVDTTGLTGSMADGDRLDWEITSVASSPTRLTVCVEYTR
jgi:hypothetical protein